MFNVWSCCSLVKFRWLFYRSSHPFLIWYKLEWINWFKLEKEWKLLKFHQKFEWWTDGTFWLHSVTIGFWRRKFELLETLESAKCQLVDAPEDEVKEERRKINLKFMEEQSSNILCLLLVSQIPSFLHIDFIYPFWLPLHILQNIDEDTGREKGRKYLVVSHSMCMETMSYSTEHDKLLQRTININFNIRSSSIHRTPASRSIHSIFCARSIQRNFCIWCEIFSFTEWLTTCDVEVKGEWLNDDDELNEANWRCWLIQNWTRMENSNKWRILWGSQGAINNTIWCDGGGIIESSHRTWRHPHFSFSHQPELVVLCIVYSIH